MNAARKILLYSHDSFGLGNIRRTLALAETFRATEPDAAILIITGSPVIHAFRVPERVDYVKLPSLDRIEADQYAPRFLASFQSEVNAMRRSVLSHTILGFEPDLFVVDKRPAGIDGELLEPLRALRERGARTRIVAGIRDILDEPIRTRRALRRSAALETIERYYDEVWIYGAREVFDPVREYAFSAEAARRVRFVGYLGRTPLPRVPRNGPPRVLVTPGGGGDGSRMIEAFLEGLQQLPRGIALRTTVVLGPEMQHAHRDRILERFAWLSDVEFLEFEPDPMRRLAATDVVVSMAGYNTVCEVLSAGVPAVVVPRSEPVQEQLIRARRMAELGCLDLVDPKLLDPARLVRTVLDALARPRARACPFALDGLARVGERARALLHGDDASQPVALASA